MGKNKILFIILSFIALKRLTNLNSVINVIISSIEIKIVFK